MKNVMHFIAMFLVLGLSISHAADSSTVQNGSDTLSQPQGSSVPEEPSQIIPWRLGVVVGAASLSYVGSYYLIFQKGWWDGPEGKFHFANDFEYALNLDKAGHFYSGILLGEGFYDALRWAGMTEFSSYLWAGSLSSLTHVGIDIKDGYSPDWGYSVFDVLAGTVGGFYPMAKRYVPAFNYFDIKWSWYKNSDAYYENSDTDILTDDYVNQTFWASLKVHRMLPNPVRRFWPAWLALAGGLSVDEWVHRGGKDGSYEFYIAADWDFEGMFQPKTHFGKRVVRYLNYFKFPSPALQVYPHTEFFIAYPIKF